LIVSTPHSNGKERFIASADGSGDEFFVDLHHVPVRQNGKVSDGSTAVTGLAGVLARVEVYYDAVPRAAARVEDIGPFTLFVASSGPAFYARPRLGSMEVSVDAVQGVLSRQRQLEQPLCIEWVAETTPALERVAALAGMNVEHHPLLVLRERPCGGSGRARMLGGDEAEDLSMTEAAIGVAFGVGGTSVGAEGLAERAASLSATTGADVLLSDVASRRIRVAAVYDRDPSVGPVGGGRHTLRADTSEITGVGVMPVYRGQGLAASLTYLLASDAVALGARTVFCCAEDDNVARIYERVGFRRLATACVATGVEVD
jgi:ribosomal protein S18 acetylase RimI-like enzyme